MKSRINRRGGVLIYATVSMTGLIGVVSLAVDWGHLEAVKTDLQRAADATSHGYLALYTNYDQATANFYGPMLYTQALNPIDSSTAPTPTSTVTWGSWDSSSNSFNNNMASGLPVAVKVVISRTAANGNGVSLTWGSVLGRKNGDVTVTSIAAFIGAATTNVTTPGTSDIWLAGMPNGSTASYDDTTSNAVPGELDSGLPGDLYHLYERDRHRGPHEQRERHSRG